MQDIQWTPEMTVGVPAMDAAHKAFLAELVRLRNSSDDEFSAGFLALVRMMEVDFQEEEQLMEDIDYPGLMSHREQHARILGCMHHVAPQIMDGNLAQARETVSLLPEWFALHLHTMDTPFALALELYRREGKGLPTGV